LLESKLLNRWQTPLVNDFFAMVFFGTLRKLLGSWCPELDEEFQNQLLCAEQNIVSTEPIERLNAIVESARREPELVALAADINPAGFLAALNRYRDLHAQFESLRQRFGARTLEELKLETITAIQDPTILAAQVVAYLNMQQQADRQQQTNEGPTAQELRAQAEQRFADALGGGLVKQRIARWVLRHTRRLVAQRENLRFERTRVFDAARSIFLAMGERLSRDGVINSSRDVFWLTKDELFDFVRGTAVDADLRGVVRQRRNSWAAYRESDVADRFETHGSPYVGNNYAADQQPVEPLTEPVLRGTGCCAGRVTALALVVTDPREVTHLEGRILVAERTDPGWTPLFPLAAGILVARGSLLSHSAIVARELGKPAVVAIPGLMEQVRTGDLVSFDGSTGEISVVRSAERPEERTA
jgi:pyruvate,water dikinase